MGALSSRRDAGAEELDTPPGSVYRYPPKSGNYFASHFIMGGQTFDSAHPEGYLFGENSDLNFLGSHPVTFPYAAPPPQDPVKTLRSLISIRKDTLRLVRCERRCRERLQTPADGTPDSNISYNVEFTFDADAQVAITIYYQAVEEFLDGCASYTSKDSSLQSETVRYQRGVCQHFCLPTHTIDPSDWMDEELACNADSTVYPMVIHAVVDEGEEHLGHSHVLLNTFDKNAEGNCSVKPLKQKQVVDGVSYLLQEIYGIENKHNDLQCKVPSDELSDNSAECVVCLSDIRDTLILPCRHLCLCNACADTLRYQANNCPICRLPFRALLQIRAMRKKVDPLPPDHPDPVIASHLPVSDNQPSSDHIPQGYEVVSLLEALNGPLSPPSAPPVHPVRDGRTPCPKSARGSEEQTPPLDSSSPLDQGTEVSAGLQARGSESRSVSQNSLVLVDEEEGRCRSEGDIPGVLHGHFHQEVEDTGVTPESENVTLSSPGVMEPSSHSPTVLSSSITSPEDPSSLTPSVMSMASSQLSTDTISSMSGSYPLQDDGSLAECDTTQHPTTSSAEEEEGNAVAKDPHGDAVRDSHLHGWWDRTALTPVCDNNNELPGMATLDNDPRPEGTAAGPSACEDRSNPWPPVPHNTEQEQATDPSPMYGPLAT